MNMRLIDRSFNSPKTNRISMPKKMAPTRNTTTRDLQRKVMDPSTFVLFHVQISLIETKLLTFVTFNVVRTVCARVQPQEETGETDSQEKGAAAAGIGVTAATDGTTRPIRTIPRTSATDRSTRTFHWWRTRCPHGPHGSGRVLASQ